LRGRKLDIAPAVSSEKHDATVSYPYTHNHYIAAQQQPVIKRNVSDVCHQLLPSVSFTAKYRITAKKHGNCTAVPSNKLSA
jgi:hypothetical protein